MTRLDFYKRHFTAVANDLLPTWQLDHPKIHRLWAQMFPNEQRALGTFFQPKDIERLRAELLRRVDALTDIDLETRTGCLASCPMFHDPKPDGTYALHWVAGGFVKIHRAISDRASEIVFRDVKTGEEFIMRSEQG